MLNDCARCGEPPTDRLFCSCGALIDKDGLKSLKLMGPIGVRHSNSASIDEFWKTGDPSVFDKPGQQP